MFEIDHSIIDPPKSPILNNVSQIPESETDYLFIIIIGIIGSGLETAEEESVNLFKICTHAKLHYFKPLLYVGTFL